MRSLVPVVADLRPSVASLTRTVGPLSRVVNALNTTVKELGYNPPGPEEGYLFWTAWFMHDSNNMLSVEDANGATWRGLVMVGCTSAAKLIATTPALAPLGEAPICPSTDQAAMKAAAEKSLAKVRRTEGGR